MQVNSSFIAKINHVTTEIAEISCQVRRWQKIVPAIDGMHSLFIILTHHFNRCRINSPKNSYSFEGIDGGTYDQNSTGSTMPLASLSSLSSDRCISPSHFLLHEKIKHDLHQFVRNINLNRKPASLLSERLDYIIHRMFFLFAGFAEHDPLFQGHKTDYS